MTKVAKKLEGYIKTLPLLGSIFLLGGLVAAFVVLTARNPEDWLLYYFHFKALGSVVGYLSVSWWNPGGRVTINFDKSTYTQEEKALDNLIVKYRSNILMLLPLILYISADFMIGKIQTQPHTGSFEGYFTSVLIGFFVTLSITMGIKYLSAWWNIKRNWKKEFGS